MSHPQASSMPKAARSPTGKAHVSPAPSPDRSPSEALSPPHRHMHAFPFDSPEPGSEVGSPPQPQQQQQHGSGRQITPVNLRATATSVSNSELRMRASPMAGVSSTSQHAFPSAAAVSSPASFGMQSRHGHSGEGGGEYASGGSLSRPGSKPGTPMASSRTHPRRNSFSLISATSNAISSPSSSSSSRRSGVFAQLLCFIGGMVLSFVLLSASLTPSPAVISVPHAESGMSGVAQRLATAITPAAAPCPTVTPPPPPPPAAPAAPASIASLLSSGKTPAQLQEELRAALPICGPHEYGDGEWVWDESVTKPPYVNHEWDNVCDNLEAPAAAADGSTPAAPAAPALRSELRWKWQPRSCRLVPYSRDSFCELLAGRNILFAGDSISGQHVLSFVHLLHPTPDKLWIRDEFFRNDFINVCQDHYPLAPGATSSSAGFDQNGKPLAGIRVGFRRNNFLSLHADVNRTEDHRKWNTNQAWIPHISSEPSFHFDIAVINTGIWMVDAPLYKSMLTDIAATLKRDHPNLTVLWRSTQPGHAFCHTHWSRPQSRLYGIADTTGGSARFRWEEAEQRNEIARSIFPQQFFDVWNATHLRPDGHMPGECLHYCQPGPLDEWHKFLYHRLAIQNPAFVQKVLAKEAAAKTAAAGAASAPVAAPTPSAPLSPSPATTPAASSTK